MEPKARIEIFSLGLDSVVAANLVGLAESEECFITVLEDLAFLPRKAFLLVQSSLLPLALTRDPARLVVIGPSTEWWTLSAPSIVDFSEGHSANELWWRIKRSMLGTTLLFSWGIISVGSELILNGRKLELSPAGESILRVLLRLYTKHPWVLPRVLYPPRSNQLGSSRVLSVHIRGIRKKIASHLGSDVAVVKTSRGKGYGLFP